MPKQPAAIARDKERRAVQLFLAGMKFDDIAEEVGYASKSGVHDAIYRAIQRDTTANVEQIRNLELGRLDELTLAVWPKARRGDLQAIHTVLKLMERRAKYVGGLEAPQKMDVTVTEVGADEVQAFMAGAHAQWQQQQAKK